MRFRFSAQAWVLGAATGLVVLPAVSSSAGDSNIEHSLHTQQGDKSSPLDLLGLGRGIQQVAGEAPGEAAPGLLSPNAIGDSKPARPLFPPLFPGRTQPTSGTVQRPSQVQTGLAQPAQALNSTQAQADATAGAYSTAVDQNASEVQKKLAELYQRDGRAVPGMMLQDMTAGTTPIDAAAPASGPTAAPQGREVAASPFKRFFQKVSPFHRNNPNDERPEHVEPLPAAARADLQRVQQGQAPQRQTAAQQPRTFSPPKSASPAGTVASDLIPPLPAPGPALVAGTDDDDSQPAAPTDFQIPKSPPQTAALPEFEPAVKLSSDARPGTVSGQPIANANPASPNSAAGSPPALDDSKLSDTPLSLPAQAEAGSADSLANPFPELSEAEADGLKEKASENPFSGLKLSESATVPTIPEIPSTDDTSALEPEAPSLSTTNTAGDQAPPLNDIPKTTTTAEPKAKPVSLAAGTAPKLPPLPVPASLSGQPQAAPHEPAKLPLVAPAQKPATESPHDARMRRIAERTELKGLKGFCPVVLRDERQLMDAKPQFQAEFDGQTFNFSSQDALDKFKADPEAYAPADSGQDIVLASDGQIGVEGKLDHAVWFKNRLYLFESRESMERFSISPAKFAAAGNNED